jgi:hypothetical protein
VAHAASVRGHATAAVSYRGRRAVLAIYCPPPPWPSQPPRDAHTGGDTGTAQGAAHPHRRRGQQRRHRRSRSNAAGRPEDGGAARGARCGAATGGGARTVFEGLEDAKPERSARPGADERRAKALVERAHAARVEHLPDHRRRRRFAHRDGEAYTQPADSTAGGEELGEPGARACRVQWQRRVGAAWAPRGRRVSCGEGVA